MKIICVGSNPAQASPDISAFHPDTRSRIVIEGWFNGIEAQISFINIYDRRTPDNRPLRVSEIRTALPKLYENIRGYDRIVALGKQADRALSMLNIDYLEMPHPSGLNRLLNDPIFVADRVEALRKYIDG